MGSGKLTADALSNQSGSQRLMIEAHIPDKPFRADFHQVSEDFLQRLRLDPTFPPRTCVESEGSQRDKPKTVAVECLERIYGS
jgi:hypothetical protein